MWFPARDFLAGSQGREVPLRRDRYDLVVIGCGPAGEKGAAQAAYFGKRVAVCEGGRLGGACVHTGTLPSKCLRESALHLSGFRNRGLPETWLPVPKPIRVETLMAHRNRVARLETERIARNMERHGIELVRGRAEILDANTVFVRGPEGERRLETSVILIATGSRPHRPADVPFDLNDVYDSDEILDLDFVPRSLAVVGAGVIGCEYATMFAALGVEVTLIEPRERLLPFLDEEIATLLDGSFGALGIARRYGWSVSEVRVERPGDVRFRATEARTGRTEDLRAEKLLYCAGRQGNTEGLGLERVGVVPDKRGLLKVDERFRTSCPTIYAAGDVIGFPALASTSMDQARVAMCHAFDLKYKTGLSHILPFGIYTIPEVSMAGETEQALAARGARYEVGRAAYADNARARILGQPEGLLKLIFRPEDRRILGVHILGERASEVIHVGATAMQLGATIDLFIDAVYNYPTLGEMYKYAAYDGLGRLAKRQEERR
jgi:NAD(P) transhydrogenase